MTFETGLRPTIFDLELKIIKTQFYRIKVAEYSFLVLMRYSSLFSNHWQLGSQNWQDTNSAKRIIF